MSENMLWWIIIATVYAPRYFCDYCDTHLTHDSVISYHVIRLITTVL